MLVCAVVGVVVCVCVSACLIGLLAMCGCVWLADCLLDCLVGCLRYCCASASLTVCLLGRVVDRLRLMCFLCVFLWLCVCLVV